MQFQVHFGNTPQVHPFPLWIRSSPGNFKGRPRQPDCLRSHRGLVPSVSLRVSMFLLWVRRCSLHVKEELDGVGVHGGMQRLTRSSSSLFSFFSLLCVAAFAGDAFSAEPSSCSSHSSLPRPHGIRKARRVGSTRRAPPGTTLRCDGRWHGVCGRHVFVHREHTWSEPLVDPVSLLPGWVSHLARVGNSGSARSVARRLEVTDGDSWCIFPQHCSTRRSSRHKLHRRSLEVSFVPFVGCPLDGRSCVIEANLQRKQALLPTQGPSTRAWPFSPSVQRGDVARPDLAHPKVEHNQLHLQDSRE